MWLSGDCGMDVTERKPNPETTPSHLSKFTPTHSFHKYLWRASHVPQAPLLGGGDAEIEGD